MEKHFSVHVKFTYAYLKLLIEFIFYPVGHMSKSNLSFTQFRPSFQFQMRRTSETIPEINRNIHMCPYSSLYSEHFNFRNMFYFWVLKMYIFAGCLIYRKIAKRHTKIWLHVFQACNYIFKCILKSNLSCTDSGIKYLDVYWIMTSRWHASNL